MKTHRALVTLIVALACVAPLLLAACGRTVQNTVDDATIAARVKTALLNDPDVRPFRIDVQAFQGVVTLSGTVRSKAEEEKVIAITRTVKGVTDVRSTLQVQP